MSVDSQKQGKAKSGGQRIDDHSFFAGSGSPRFPKGVHTKDYSSSDGSGSLMKYEQTSEEIHGVQNMQQGKIKGHPLKSGTRN